jgi:hypothetical protein
MEFTQVVEEEIPTLVNILVTLGHNPKTIAERMCLPIERVMTILSRTGQYMTRREYVEATEFSTARHAVTPYPDVVDYCGLPCLKTPYGMHPVHDGDFIVRRPTVYHASQVGFNGYPLEVIDKEEFHTRYEPAVPKPDDP